MTRKISNKMLTAYVLGELKDETKTKVESILQKDTAIKAEVEALRAVAQLATEAFGKVQGPDLTLTDDQRTQVRQTATEAMNELFSAGGGIFDTTKSDDEGPDFSGNMFNTPAPGSLKTELFSSVSEDLEPTAISRAIPLKPSAEASPVGQRNENSVLFSLSSLQDMARVATPAQEPKSPTAASRSEEASGLIDIRALAQVVGSRSKSRTEDEFALAPSAFSPVLAPRQQKSKLLMPFAIAASVVLSAISVVVIMTMMNSTQSANVSETDAKITELSALLSALQKQQGSQPDADMQKLQEEIARLETKRAAEESTTEVKGEPVEIAKAAPAASAKSKSRSRGAGQTKKAALTAAKKPPASAPKDNTGDLNDLLGGSESPIRPSTGSGSKPLLQKAAGGLPHTPTKSQVKAAMSKVASRVKACGRGESGIVKVKIVINGPTGRVTTAKARAPFSGTPTGSCAERAVKGARFPKFKKSSLSVTYPFKL